MKDTITNSKTTMMNHEDIQIEEALLTLRPRSLSDDLLDRLDQAMAQEAEVIDEPIEAGLSALEESLKGLAPYGVPEDMISRLDQAMSRWHEHVPVEEKVVQMHPAAAPSQRTRLRWSSAAAVALMGAAAAFFTGQSNPASPQTVQRIPVLTNGKATPVVFQPADARASVVATNDHGVVWTKSGRPVRCVEVEVNNQLQFVNAKGARLIIEQPKREVNFTPVRVD